MYIDQSQRNEGPTNKVRNAGAYLGVRGRVVQKGIGEPTHVVAHTCVVGGTYWIGLLHRVHGGHGLRCPAGLGLGAPSKVSHRLAFKKIWFNNAQYLDLPFVALEHFG